MSRDDNRNAMADCIVLSKQQACAITNLSADTLDRLHRKHAGPPRVQLSPRRRIMAREAQHGLTCHVTTVGNVIGLGPFYQVEGDFHYSKLFLCLIGATSKGRKGTSLNRVRQILKLVDENWNQYRVQSVRLLIEAEEFASVIAVMSKPGAHRHRACDVQFAAANARWPL